MIGTVATTRRNLFAAAAILAASLFGSAVKAQSSGFESGNHWSGFTQSSVTMAVRGQSSLTIDQSAAGRFTGHLTTGGRVYGVAGSVATDGSVDISGTGIKMHGRSEPLGDQNVVTRFNYQMSATNDQGTIELLRLYPPDPCTPVVFPPDPCRGTFVSRTGVTGSLVFENGLPSDHAPPSDFNGLVRFGNLSYNSVGTMAQRPNADGSYAYALLGQSARPDGGTAFIRIVGLYKPGSITPCIHDAGFMLGTYIGLDINGKTLDLGSFQMLRE